MTITSCFRDAVHHAECSDTSGTFIRKPALNVKANQDNACQTIEWITWKFPRGLTFCSFTGKLLVIAISYYVAFIEERSIKQFLLFFIFWRFCKNYRICFNLAIWATCLYEKSLSMHFETKYLLKELFDLVWHFKKPLVHFRWIAMICNLLSETRL